MRLSLTDLAKVVLACAVASLCITPGHRVSQFHGVTSWRILIVDAVIVPLVWALFVFVFVRHGPRRTALVEGLILGAVAVALSYLAWGVAAFNWPRLRTYGLRGIWAEDLVMASVALGLATLAGFLGVRLVRRTRGFFARRRSSG